ncbi:MAG TPA: protein kinase [Longimicrobium sp.]|jgi:tRNA A-37 threonylcarbamoyl transferase component Bud32|uniref:protein kinase domain-containing protein n=1 Tax=Longimicrobium sp. TaxID=2029185 RepID=UPI002ED94EBD
MSGLAQFLVGHVLNDRYRLQSVLGEGGFGVVFRAVDERMDRPVAVKVLVPPRGMGAAQTERLRQRFQGEAELAARLPAHPNLVGVLDYGADDRVDFLVMELLEGESLRDRLARPEPIPLRTALGILLGAARGVAVGHQNGLVHRDLKPANLFLESDPEQPEVRVLDFGIAKMLDDAEDEETRTHLTLPGEWFGSEFYCAPEHLRRERVTRGVDVYSLGVVGFELLTRTRLFTPEDQNRRRQGLPVPIPSLLARNASVPSEVEWVIRRALADDPAQRYADAGALASELHRVLNLVRRAADFPDAAVVAVPADDRRAVSVQPDEGTMLVADAPAGRRAVELDPTSVEGRLQAVRRKRWRTLAVRAAGVVVLGTGGVAGGVALAANRAYEAPRQAASSAPALSPGEENQEGLRLFRNADYENAAEHFRRAADAAPDNAEFQNNYAYALYRAGKAQDGIQLLKDVVQRYPHREVAYSNLAEAQLASADTTGAVNTLLSLLAIQPSPARRREAEILLDRLGFASGVWQAPATGAERVDSTVDDARGLDTMEGADGMDGAPGEDGQAGAAGMSPMQMTTGTSTAAGGRGGAWTRVSRTVNGVTTDTVITTGEDGRTTRRVETRPAGATAARPRWTPPVRSAPRDTLRM